MIKKFVLVLATGVLMAGPAPAALHVFGDSLSDSGNMLDISTGLGFPIPNPAIYSDGGASNGPVWVNYLAANLGEAAPTNSRSGGTNFAHGGATVSEASLGGNPLAAFTVSIESQVNQFLGGSPTIANDDLFVMFGGANDFFFGQTDASIAANKMIELLEDLQAAGVQRFLVPGLPPIERTPFIVGNGTEVAAGAFADQYDQILFAGIDLLRIQHPSVEFTTLDLQTLFADIEANPGLFGFTNVVDAVTNFDPAIPLATSGPIPGRDPDTYLFFDGVHPTTITHEELANFATAQIPEPTTIGMVATAAALFGITSYRRRHVSTTGKQS